MENYGFIRCAIANVSSGLASPKKFRQHFNSFLEQIEGKNVQIALFPELCVTGYTCQDLFLNQNLYDEVLETLESIRIASNRSNALFIVGPFKCKVTP